MFGFDDYVSEYEQYTAQDLTDETADMVLEDVTEM